MIEAKEFMVAYASRSNNNAKAEYSLYEGECLVAVWAIAHFQCYLYGSEFLLVTDHQPLKWFTESDKLSGKLVRWALMLQEYDFKVVHRSGLLNMDANGLIRNPCPSQKDSTGVRWHVGEDEEEMPRWYASMCLSLLATNGKSSNDSSTKIEREEESGGAKDVFEDGPVLDYLRWKELALDVTPKERDRILQQAKWFEWEGVHILKKFPNGGKRVVPRPQDREKLVFHIYEELEHFGMKRTYNLLQSQYWWIGI